MNLVLQGGAALPSPTIAELARLARARRLSLKSSSPFMAASVMVATSALKPFMSAISSMHSILIRVESISVMNTRMSVRRRPSGMNA